MTGKKKMYKKGLADGVQATEGFLTKEAAGLAFVRAELQQNVSDISESILGLRESFDDVFSYLGKQENKDLYHLCVPVDLKELEKDEQRLLLAILYQLANDEGDLLTEVQQSYIRSVQRYMGIANPQTTLDDFSVVGEVDSVDVQQVIYETVLEFLYLQDGDEYSEMQGSLLDNFSLNKKQREMAELNVARMYAAIGPEGIAEHYGAAKVVVKSIVIETGSLELRKRAEEAYLRYDIKEAMPFFKLLSEQGDGRSCYFLGKYYAAGYQGLVQKNAERAADYYKQGADAGDVLCQMMALYYGNSETECNTIVPDMLNDLALSGDIYAMFELARILLNDRNLEGAIGWFAKAGDAGLWRALSNLGAIYEEQEQYEDALECYQKAAAYGDEVAINGLADLYFYGEGVAENEEKAVELYQKAAAMGNANAQWSLGRYYYYNGRYTDAREWLMKSSEGGINGYYLAAKAVWKGGLNEDNPGGLEQMDCWIYYLLLGAREGYINCLIELASLHPIFTEIINTISLKMDFHGDIGSSEALLHIEPIPHMELDELEAYQGRFSSWARKILEVYAENGNDTAQYYLAQAYIQARKPFSKKDRQWTEYTEQAIKWLRQAGQTENISKEYDKHINEIINWLSGKGFHFGQPTSWRFLE